MMEHSRAEKLERGLQQLHICYTKEQIDQFLDYYEMLVEKNKVMNLTAITAFDEVVEKHFLDSVFLVSVIQLENSQKTLLDLGTGAGFPGIPLKILFPDLQITLMDSLNKRIVFLKEVIDALSLKQITAVHGRAEEAARDRQYREQFDICVSRAVANIATLSEYCLPFVKVGGTFISYKSAQIEEELTAGKKSVFLLGGKVMEVRKFMLPETDMERSFVMIEKVKHTPKTYPRKAGTPKKSPLI